MIRYLKNLISSIDNHVDILDNFNRILEKAIGSVRKKYGY